MQRQPTDKNEDRNFGNSEKEDWDTVSLGHRGTVKWECPVSTQKSEPGFVQGVKTSRLCYGVHPFKGNTSNCNRGGKKPKTNCG